LKSNSEHSQCWNH